MMISLFPHANNFSSSSSFVSRHGMTANPHTESRERERETSTMCDMTLILSEPSQIESGWELAPIHSEALKQ